MRKLATPLVALAVAWPFVATAASEGVLRQWLGTAVHSASGNYGVAVEYCPDNTCERLVAPTPVARSEFDDFAFLYFATRSEYAYLKDNRPPEVKAQIDTVLNKYSSLCQPAKGASCAEVVLRHLRARTGASLYLVRFDEGYKCTEPQALLGVRPSGAVSCVK